jgi:hypothetical protein
MQTLNTHLALNRDDELRAASAAPRPRLGTDHASARDAGRLVLRRARPQDGAAVAHLAALDEAPIPRGDLLLVELDERIVAAVPVRGGQGVADPFQHTAGLVDLAERRAALLRGEPPRRGRLGGVLRHVASGRRAAA